MTPQFRPSLGLLESRDTPAVSINPSLAEQFAVGGHGLNATARLVHLQTDGSLAVDLEVVPYPGFTGEVHVAAADVNLDGFDDLITAAGAGGGPHVKVFDGRTGAELASFFAYDAAFTGGVNLAAADVNLDGRADIITGAGAGGGPHVKVFSGASSTEIWSFFAYAPAFTGGVSVAAGDITLDGNADIATGAGPGGGPHVKVFDGRTLDTIQSYMAFDPTSTRGVNVALGDADLDTRADLVTAFASAAPTSQSNLTAVGGVALPPAIVSFTQNPFLPSTFTRAVDPFGSEVNTGLEVGMADVDGDGRQDVLFGTSSGDSLIRIVFARDLLAGTTLLNSVLIEPVFDSPGVFVG